MCVNYKPPEKSTVAALTGVDTEGVPDWPEQTWQDYAAPLVRAGSTCGAAPELLVGSYGMIPKNRMPAGVRLSTMNARAETIGERRSYAQAWRRAQTCLVPLQWFCEPNYESGRARRWAIGMADDAPFCVAGLWHAWEEPEGGYSYSFTQITVNADDHRLMRRFQKPGDEKRSLVIVPPSQYRAWLQAGSPERAWPLLQLYPATAMKTWELSEGYRPDRENGQQSAFAF